MGIAIVFVLSISAIMGIAVEYLVWGKCTRISGCVLQFAHTTTNCVNSVHIFGTNIIWSLKSPTLPCQLPPCPPPPPPLPLTLRWLWIFICRAAGWWRDVRAQDLEPIAQEGHRQGRYHTHRQPRWGVWLVGRWLALWQLLYIDPSLPPSLPHSFPPSLPLSLPPYHPPSLPLSPSPPLSLLSLLPLIQLDSSRDSLYILSSISFLTTYQVWAALHIHNLPGMSSIAHSGHCRRIALAYFTAQSI